MTYESIQLAGYSGDNSIYTHESAYYSYIQGKIDAENRLAYAMKEEMILSEADYSNIRAIQEASFGDKVKAKWQKFVTFIKGIMDKFMESMSKIILNEKEYLEKYKDIILNKKPKDIDYSYTGNLSKGEDRITETKLPVFDYNVYEKELTAEGQKALVNKLLPDFNYKEGDSSAGTLAEQLKNYYIGNDDGTVVSGKLSDSNVNFKTMYNFCYNYKKIESIVNSDRSRLEQSTNNIKKAFDKIANENKKNNDEPREEDSSGSASQTGQSENATQVNHSVAIMYFKEDENADADKNKSAGDTGIKVSSNVSDHAGSYSGERNEKEEEEKGKAMSKAIKGDDAAKKAEDAVNKWINVCKDIICAKFTGAQEIAGAYMAMIRAHVRSYGGKDKTDKKNNRDTGQTAKTYGGNKTDQGEHSQDNAEGGTSSEGS